MKWSVLHVWKVKQPHWCDVILIHGCLIVSPTNICKYLLAYKLCSSCFLWVFQQNYCICSVTGTIFFSLNILGTLSKKTHTSHFYPTILYCSTKITTSFFKTWLFHQNKDFFSHRWLLCKKKTLKAFKQYILKLFSLL